MHSSPPEANHLRSRETTDHFPIAVRNALLVYVLEVADYLTSFYVHVPYQWDITGKHEAISKLARIPTYQDRRVRIQLQSCVGCLIR